MSGFLAAHRKHPARSLAALVLACLSLLTPLAELAHVAGAHHVRCADHGEEVHLAAAPAGPLDLAQLARTPAVDAAPGSAPAEAHAHCALTPGHLSRLCAGPPPAATLAPSPSLLVSPLPVATPRAPRLRALRLAPKTSPPPALA